MTRGDFFMTAIERERRNRRGVILVTSPILPIGCRPRLQSPYRRWNIDRPLDPEWRWHPARSIPPFADPVVVPMLVVEAPVLDPARRADVEPEAPRQHSARYTGTRPYNPKPFERSRGPWHLCDRPYERRLGPIAPLDALGRCSQFQPGSLHLGLMRAVSGKAHRRVQPFTSGASPLMPSPCSSLRPRLDAFAATLALSTALACAAHRSPPAAATPVTTTSPAASAGGGTRPAPAVAARPSRDSEASEPGASADSVVSLIAKPSLWPLDVDSARRVLETLGPVSSEQPSTDELSLVGGPFGALEGFDVAYSKDDDNYWVFGSAGFFLKGSDLSRLHRNLEARLTQLLGKPVWSRSENGAALRTSAWNLGEGITLSLAPCSEGRPCLAVVAGRSSDDRAKLAEEEERLQSARFPAQD
jgi:hypothetical protein